MRGLGLCAVLLVAACGGNHVGDDQGDASIDSPPPPPGWTTLIERSWQLPAYYEQYLCRVMKVPADMYITGYHLVAPTGTHHTILTITDQTTVGDSTCTPTTTDPSMLYAGGINTNDLVFPSGVAIKVSAGQYIKLELHLFNPSDTAISGTSGVQIKTAMASEVVNEGDMLFLGNIDNWTIAPTNTSCNIYGSCGAPTSWHIFAAWPHMHTYGTHQKVAIRRSATSTVDTLLDTAYDFREQKLYGPMDMVVNTGDMLEVTCTYLNSSTSTISQGDTSTDEMCLTGLLKYPKGGDPYFCAALGGASQCL